MKQDSVKTHRKRWAHILKGTYLVIYGGIGVYVCYELIRSGLIPSLYIVLYVILFFLLGIALGTVLLKSLKKYKKTTRSILVIISLLFIGASAVGVYFLKSGLGTLTAITTTEKSVEVKNNTSFNVFISGIDTYGDIATQSRSDVNMVATVNPNTRSVQLTTIPRDAYVRIAGGGNNEYDKLTHAGNYGVESSMQTVAQLLDTPIDAYIRINFSSFIESIDKLGGIIVNNPTSFESFGTYFPEGELELDGKRALIFARERKNLKEGDVDRGRNQQRVIQAVINKVTDIKSIEDFNVLLEATGNSVETNISADSIKAIISRQIASPARWTTKTYTITGRGQTGGLSSYAMSGSALYMYVLDENSVREAQSRIAATKQ